VIAAPYIMFFDKFIRHALLDWMASSLQDVVLIVDEAHNLPEYSRELESADLSAIALKLAEREVDEFGDPEVSDGISLRDFIAIVNEVLDKTVDEYLIDEDGIIPQSHLEEELMFRTRLTSKGLSGLLSQVSNFGEMVRDQKRIAGRLPRSYVHGTAGFLSFWQGLDEGEYVKLITEGDARAFEAYCMDAAIACKPIAECHASVHMSGTLRPLADYRQSIGLPKDARLAEIESPFPPEHRLVLHVDDVTTKYEDVERDDSMTERIADHITELVTGLARSTIIFYPSYALMDRISKKTALALAGRKVYFEQKDLGQGEFMRLVEEFRLTPGRSVFHAISGGRISEGMDFPGQEMDLAVIAGIPYPKPTAKQRALQHFCEIRFGNGWEHAVKAPTARKLQQAVGRLIRSETDRGVAVILDKRAVHFREILPARKTESLLDDVREFFEKPPLEHAVTHTAAPPSRRGLQL